MAAYAALVSLMNTMENIRNHPRLSTSLDKKQIESLGEKLDFLLDFVESDINSHGGTSKDEVEDLASQIASAAHVAEDVIEFHIVDQILVGSIAGDHEETRSSFLLGLQKIIEEMDSIKEKVTEVKNERGLKDQQPKSAMPAASSTPLTPGKATVVGFESYSVQLLDWLTGQQHDQQIIPITGMGGIGKTTLARNIYENSLITQHFDFCAWVTVSQDYDVREIASQILSCLRLSIRRMDEMSEHELGEELYRSLSGRRYFIILDDIWSIEAWYKIKFFFPDNRKRSRIIVTTRILNVASHFGSMGLALNLLDDDQSWDVFCEVFGEEGCPPKLEKIGKKIVQKCRGLPLSIVVIGGLLKKSSGTQEYWEYVANDLSSILNSTEENQCLNILSLSYSHLPACLKPCFLYLGIFPEDHEIRVSRLIKLWVAEGFLKPNRDESLEEVAKGYIKDLVDRNLVLVRKLGMNRKFKTCKIHDLLRDLCIKVAKKDKFFCVVRERDTPRDRYRERRIVINGSISKEQYQSQASLARSVISERCRQFLSKSKLLRVLYNAFSDSDTISQQVNLRFLQFYPMGKTDWIYAYKLPSSISLLWNLQTLIIEAGLVEVIAPFEIWEMPQIRHLKFMRICLPDPPPSDKRDGTVLRNLQTLRRVLNFKCSEEACKKMPNIKKLHIGYDDFSGEGETSLSEYSLYNVGHLNKLESLYYNFYKAPNRNDLVQNLTFPSSLRKLCLRNCGLNWNDLTIIASLPHLEVLKLLGDAVRGPEWNPIEGEFLHLKYLEIFRCPGLIYWNADSSHFPVLEKLVLDSLHALNEIPSGIGEIPTLEDISVFCCSISAAISAMKILEEQESLGNEGIHVQVQFWHEEEVEEFREIVEQEGFTCLNFQVCSC